jgi:hypothetical protein
MTDGERRARGDGEATLRLDAAPGAVLPAVPEALGR